MLSPLMSNLIPNLPDNVVVPIPLILPVFVCT